MENNRLPPLPPPSRHSYGDPYAQQRMQHQGPPPPLPPGRQDAYPSYHPPYDGPMGSRQTSHPPPMSAGDRRSGAYSGPASPTHRPRTPPPPSYGGPQPSRGMPGQGPAQPPGGGDNNGNNSRRTMSSWESSHGNPSMSAPPSMAPRSANLPASSRPRPAGLAPPYSPTGSQGSRELPPLGGGPGSNRDYFTGSARRPPPPGSASSGRLSPIQSRSISDNFNPRNELPDPWQRSATVGPGPVPGPPPNGSGGGPLPSNRQGPVFHGSGANHHHHHPHPQQHHHHHHHVQQQQQQQHSGPVSPTHPYRPLEMAPKRGHSESVPPLPSMTPRGDPMSMSSILSGGGSSSGHRHVRGGEGSAKFLPPQEDRRVGEQRVSPPNPAASVSPSGPTGASASASQQQASAQNAPRPDPTVAANLARRKWSGPIAEEAERQAAAWRAQEQTRFVGHHRARSGGVEPVLANAAAAAASHFGTGPGNARKAQGQGKVQSRNATPSHTPGSASIPLPPTSSAAPAGAAAESAGPAPKKRKRESPSVAQAAAERARNAGAAPGQSQREYMDEDPRQAKSRRAGNVSAANDIPVSREMMGGPGGPAGHYAGPMAPPPPGAGQSALPHMAVYPYPSYAGYTDLSGRMVKEEPYPDSRFGGPPPPPHPSAHAREMGMYGGAPPPPPFDPHAASGRSVQQQEPGSRGRPEKRMRVEMEEYPLPPPYAPVQGGRMQVPVEARSVEASPYGARIPLPPAQVSHMPPNEVGNMAHGMHDGMMPRMVPPPAAGPAGNFYPPGSSIGPPMPANVATSMVGPPMMGTVQGSAIADAPLPVPRDLNAGPRVDSEPVWEHLERCERQEAERRLNEAIHAKAMKEKEPAEAKEGEDAATEGQEGHAKSAIDIDGGLNEIINGTAAPGLGLGRGRPVNHLGTWIYDPLVDPLIPGDLLATNIGATLEVRISGERLGPGPSIEEMQKEYDATFNNTNGMQRTDSNEPGSTVGRWRLGWRGREHARMTREMRAAMSASDPGHSTIAAQRKRLSLEKRFGSDPKIVSAKANGRKATSAQSSSEAAWAFRAMRPLAKRKLWGTDVYSDDSDVLAMCVHAGWVELPAFPPGEVAEWLPSGLAMQQWKKMVDPDDDQHAKTRTDREGGEGEQDSMDAPLRSCDLSVVLRIAPRLIAYKGCHRAGIKSRSWGNTHDGVSLVVESVELREPGNAFAGGRKAMKKRIDQLAMLHLLANTASERPHLFAGGPAKEPLDKGKEEEEEALRQLVRGSTGLISLREIGSRVAVREEQGGEEKEEGKEEDEKENEKARVVQKIHRKLWSWREDAQQSHQSRPVQAAS